MGRGLPEGRGFRQGPGASAEQGESNAIRRKLLPSQTGWAVSSLPLWSAAGVVGIGASIGVARLIYAGEQSVDVFAVEARIRVTTLQAASKIMTAIYIFDTATRTMKKLPGSDATFDSSSNGQKNTPVACTIKAGSKVFVALTQDTANIQVNGAASTNRPANILTLTSTTWAPSYPLSALTKDPNITIPLVCYLSQDASIVL
jgi:hypothetical protein